VAELAIRHTRVFSKNLQALEDPHLRFVINQGGSRSSKTYSLCQLVIFYCLQNENKIVSIVRKSFPALRGSVMRDFFDIMNELGIYDESYHNKTENVYGFPNGSRVEFFSIDDAQKVRGRKRDLLWANESNELSVEDFTQLKLRTVDKMFFDFNPSDDEHWLYDVIDQENSILIHSTYKDNVFLGAAQVKDIEDLIQIDQSYYNIYALGLPSKSQHTIYTHQKPYIEELQRYDRVIYGLDFGFKHPTALIKCQFKEDMVFVKETIYESHLTSEDLVSLMKKMNISRSDLIVADYARPEMIEEIARAGYNIVNANKNVAEGIDAVKRSKLFYHEDSQNIKKEFRNYKWKEIGGRLMDEPVKLWDDAMDAIRYAVLYHKKTSPSGGGGIEFISF
jgi:phage terminase large subunit